MLPPLPDIEIVSERLKLIFTKGTPQLGYVTREIASKTVFTLLYIGAVFPLRCGGPKQVYLMGDMQSKETSELARLTYATESLRKGFVPKPGRWYADNSRESIRDETLKDGLALLGAVIIDTAVPTTSQKPRYALQSDFAALFDPSLKGPFLEQAIAVWQRKHLSAGARARVSLVRQGAILAKNSVLVTLPNGSTRVMSPGRSSVITKALIEVFSKRYLVEPAVIWISESGNKVVLKDEALASSLGLNINAQQLLPDVILADLSEPFLLIFVEIVATDGPITSLRQDALLKLAQPAGYDRKQLLFVTAFEDRGSAPLKKALPNLAWGSFVWCTSEPDNIIAFDGSSTETKRILRDF